MDIDDDDRFQQRQWAVQRIAWVFLSMVPFAGLLGIFGDGVMSRRSVRIDAGTVRFERFARRTADTALRIRLTGEDVRQRAVIIRLSAAYAAAMRPAAFLPTPTSMQLGSDWLELRYDPASTGSDKDVEVLVELRPDTWGWIDGVLQVDGKESLAVQHVVWP